MLYYILFNNNLTAEQAVTHFLITIFVFMISLTLHEFAHGLAAVKMGDPTPKLAGRLSLNPFKHLDLKGFMFFVFLGIGWAKPMPVNPMNFKKLKKGTRIVSIAGVIANFLLGLIAAVGLCVLFATVTTTSIVLEYVVEILIYFMLVNSFLFMFNILPIYPLDGFNFITTFMKSENKFIKFNLKKGFSLLMIILLVSIVIDVMFGFDIFDFYLTILYNYIYLPICSLGV